MQTFTPQSEAVQFSRHADFIGFSEHELALRKQFGYPPYRHLIHHQYRNLLVLGASAYPTASPAYPTLTVSALSLWAADHLLGGAA